MIAVIRNARVQNCRVKLVVLACPKNHSFDIFRPRQIGRDRVDLNAALPLKLGAQRIEPIHAPGDGNDIGSVVTREHNGHRSA
jgi:hypothetical protein